MRHGRSHTFLSFFSCYGSYLLLVPASLIIWMPRESPGSTILVILFWQKILSHSFLKPRLRLSLCLVRQVNCTDVCNWTDRLKLNTVWLWILTVYLSSSLHFLAQSRYLSVNAFKTVRKDAVKQCINPSVLKWLRGSVAIPKISCPECRNEVWSTAVSITLIEPVSYFQQQLLTVTSILPWIITVTVISKIFWYK